MPVAQIHYLRKIVGLGSIVTSGKLVLLRLILSH